MLVEVISVNTGLTGRGQMRVIAVQYHAWDKEMEAKMRRAEPLFDTPMPGMSEMMRQRISDGTHRTAIFELAE